MATRSQALTRHLWNIGRQNSECWKADTPFVMQLIDRSIAMIRDINLGPIQIQVGGGA